MRCRVVRGSRSERGSLGPLLIAVARVPDRVVGPAPRPPELGECQSGLIGCGGGPEEAGQFPGDGDGDNTVRFAAGFHLLIDAVKSALGFV